MGAARCRRCCRASFQIPLFGGISGQVVGLVRIGAGRWPGAHRAGHRTVINDPHRVRIVARPRPAGQIGQPLTCWAGQQPQAGPWSPDRPASSWCGPGQVTSSGIGLVRIGQVTSPKACRGVVSPARGRLHAHGGRLESLFCLPHVIGALLRQPHAGIAATVST